ncbi:hypothetical protein ACVRW4_07530 [Streptococcus phocae subsp. phocae]
MIQLCKKLAISTMAALALAGASLTVSTQMVKADGYDFTEFETEFLNHCAKPGYQELLRFLENIGVDEETAEFYLDFNLNMDFTKTLEEYKTQSIDELKTKVDAEVDRIFEEAAPIPVIGE